MSMAEDGDWRLETVDSFKAACPPNGPPSRRYTLLPRGKLQLPATTVQLTCRLALHAQQGGVSQRVLVGSGVGVRGVDRVIHLRGQPKVSSAVEQGRHGRGAWQQLAAPAT